MSLYGYVEPEFQLVVGSNLTTRPAAAFGVTTNAAGNNSYGTYKEILAGASNTDDAFAILIQVNSLANSAAARDAIMTLGVDPAGGSSYTALINDLLVSCAAPYNLLHGGVWYYFPVFVKAGSSIAVKLSCNGATPTCSVSVQLFCKPSRPEFVRFGTKVVTYGATTASSSGTAVTSGTSSEGSWTALASGIGESPWFWQVGFGVNDSTMANVLYHLDLSVGDASNKKLVVENQPIVCTSVEACHKPLWLPFGASQAKSGDNVYARLQCSGTADSNLSVAAYGVV